MKEMFKNIIFSLIVLSVFIVFLELIVSVFGASPGLPAIQESFYGFNWALKANHKSHGVGSRKEYTYSIDINNKRLRGEEVKYKKDPNEYRILVLGDSHTFGIGVEENETFSKHIENILNKSKKNDLPEIKVINAGMPGIATYHEMIFLENEGIKYQPDLVILFLFINDFDGNLNSYYSFDSITYAKDKNELITSGFHYYESEETYLLSAVRFVFNAIPFYDLLSIHSSLLNFVKQRILVFIKKRQDEKENELISLFEKNNLTSVNWLDKDTNRLQSISTRLGAKSLASILITKSFINRMRDYTHDNDINFLVAIIPVKEQIIDRALMEEYASFENSKNLNILNLESPFKEIEKNNLSFLFFPSDMHITPTGHLTVGYYTALSITNLFFNRNDFFKEKMEKYFHELMKTTRNNLITKLNSIKDFPLFHFYKATILANGDFKKNIREIIYHYKQYINLSEKEHKASKYLAYHNLGKAELVAGNVNEAIYYLRQIRSFNKKMSAEIESELGLCFYIQKKYAEAKEAFSNSIMLEPGLPAGYFGLGLIYLDQKLYTKAIESLKKANEIKPDDSSITRALNYANIMQLELEGDLPPAN